MKRILLTIVCCVIMAIVMLVWHYNKLSCRLRNDIDTYESEYPTKFFITPSIMPALYQGSETRTCMAHAVASAMFYNMHQKKLTPFYPSRAYMHHMYYWTRSSDTVDEYLNKISNEGVCPEYMYPYDVNDKDNTQKVPPQAVKDVASKYTHLEHGSVKV